MYTVSKEELSLLRKLKYWKTEEFVSRNVMERSREQVDNVLRERGDANISPSIINLVLLDKNGSGVVEILTEHEIKITD